MPQTAKGKKILAAMKKEYGKDAKSVYYASIVKGKIKGAEGPGGTGKLAKAKATYSKKHSKTSKKMQQVHSAMKKVGSNY